MATPLFARSIKLDPTRWDLVATLGMRVRLLTATQIEAGWFPGVAPEELHELLRDLERLDYLRSARLPAMPLLHLVSPLHVWEPGDATPSFTALAKRISARWIGSMRRTTVYIASPRTANHFLGHGGTVKFPRQATHDLHVAAVYLHYRDRDLLSAQRWTFEDVLATERARGEKIPDAVLREQTQILRVVEFAGRYDHFRLRKFHTYCREEGLPYELW